MGDAGCDMSKWENHKDRGNTTFNRWAEANSVAKMTRENNTWMHQKGKLCWKCQKQSVPEKGCIINLQMGLHKYVCKPCVDARKPKEVT